MKTLLYMLFLLMLLMATGSCSKDENDPVYTTPSNLVGTTWKCSTDLNWDEELDYLILKFTSTTGVEGWSKYKNTALQQDWIGTFTISDKTITIKEGELEETITGTINGVTMNLSNVLEEGYMTFTLQ